MTDKELKLLKDEIRKLKIPSEFWGIDLDDFNNYQYNMYLSVRQVAGKTTQSLLLGLVLIKCFPEHYNRIEYLRNDKAQIVRANIETMFDTIIELGYFRKIYGSRWNGITYKPQQRKFYLVNKDEDGNIIETDSDCICAVHAVEKSEEYKSSYSNNKGNYIVLDECCETSRASYTIFVEFLNAISTIGRPLSPGRAEYLRVLMLGNNQDRYSFWFDEFNVNDDIENLTFGGRIYFRTEYNTTGVIQLLEQSERHKERIRSRNIPFLGFTSKKAAAFTGLTEFSGKTYKHIHFELDYEYCLYRRVYIYHRCRYIQLDYFKDGDRLDYVFAHFANAPQLDDNIILTLDPRERQHVYGVGAKDERERIYDICKKYFYLHSENRWYYASNKVGSLIDDYISNVD